MQRHCVTYLTIGIITRDELLEGLCDGTFDWVRMYRTQPCTKKLEVRQEKYIKVSHPIFTFSV